ncbi:uncharacterized protein LOC142584189 [Dermacentor variabilis]|uniref:uncharacterized protein LOC142584189 n=1 Tax=Dermacentor variabilis TaxID=34621 RepID=UPI003F5B58C3
MAEGAFVEGDQAPRDKDPEEDLQERVPSRLVEEHGDDALRQPPHAEVDSATLCLQPFQEAALDESLMVRELLKKGRLKNPTLTEKGAPLLLEDRRLSVLLEATQNVALRYQLRGKVQQQKPLSPELKSHDVPGTSVAAIADSHDTGHLEEKVHSVPGSTARRVDASCSGLPTDGAITDENVRKSPPPAAATKSALYSPSQADARRVKSRLAQLTVEKPSQLRAGDEVCSKLSKITQIVTGGCCAEPATTPQLHEHDPLSSPSRLEQEAPVDPSSEGPSDDRIRDMPVLEVLDKCDLVELSTGTKRARRRMRRYCGTDAEVAADAGLCSSDSERSLVKLDFSTLPTEASEMVADRRCGAEVCDEPTRAEKSSTSTSSWYSFDPPSAASRQSSAVRAAASASESAGSWAARRQGSPASPDVPRERLKASSLIRFFEGIN